MSEFMHHLYNIHLCGEETLDRVLGIEKLPILSRYSRLAELLMYKAHVTDTGLDHRGVQATLVRSRQYAFIVLGLFLNVLAAD